VRQASRERQAEEGKQGMKVQEADIGAGDQAQEKKKMRASLRYKSSLAGGWQEDGQKKLM
jgi:hypothetical protein